MLGLRALDLALDRYALKILPRSEQFYRDIMAEARKEVGTINVAVTVDQAIVDVDGETIRNWPFFDRIYVMPGKHEVKAMRLGYYSSHSNVTIVAGETREVTLALQPRVSTEMIPVPVAGAGAGAVRRSNELPDRGRADVADDGGDWRGHRCGHWGRLSS